MDSFLSPESSNIAGATYDDNAGTLVVTFNNGGEYEYLGVSPIVWTSFKRAPSKGRYFARNIKNQFPTNKVA
jgi:hypothetical protein